MDDQMNRVHKSRTGGSKAAKKERVKKEKRGLDTTPNRGKNAKAFTQMGAQSYKVKQAAKSLEKKEITLHKPSANLFSCLYEEPPLLVIVVGPPQSGKSTLIRSMVKFYAHRNLQRISGPITVVAGRTRRITFFECPNTLGSMCDLAKVADLVILVVDGFIGFEMETFEFLSVAQVHGLPKVIGVVTHLDMLKTNKNLRKRKKLMRHRFWHEVAVGAKLICIAPLLKGSFRSADVLKLHRLLVTTQPKLQAWRTTHSCVFVDRCEDISNPDDVTANPKCERTIALYGYVRGHPLRPGGMIHVPGYGDAAIQHVSRQDDPCPGVPTHGKKNDGNAKLRHLSNKHKKIYAPYCVVAGLDFDESAVYIHEDADRRNIERSGKGFTMLRELQESAELIDTQMSGAQIEVVRRPATFAGEDECEEEVRVEEDVGELVRSSESSEVDDEALLQELAEVGGPRSSADTKMQVEEELSAEAAEGELVPRKFFAKDSTRINTAKQMWDSDEGRALAKIFFVTGKWVEADHADGSDGSAAGVVDKGYESISEADADGPADDAPQHDAALKVYDADSDNDDVAQLEAEGVVEQDEEVEDLIEHFASKTYQRPEIARKEEFFPSSQDAEGSVHDDADDEGDGQQGLTAEQQEYRKKKIAKKKQFDESYDTAAGKSNTMAFYHHLQQEEEKKMEEMQKTMSMVGEDIDKKIALVGYFSGLYVRLVLENVPVEFLRTFSPNVPIIAGGLNSGEDQLGMVHAMLRRHRWHPKILKAQDPLVVSIGWRRIHTQPIFATEDPNGRLRYLKYTPQHMHCMSAFFGPITPPNTGILTYSLPESRKAMFRITSSGYVIGVDATTSIVKKLKLTGVPSAIQKTTCFIKGMFNSDIEAAKFVGAKVKSVSGLRGIIKAAMKGKSGVVRCSFEDKLLMSDIVFIRSWTPVDPPRYCAVVQDLLDANWFGMRTMAQLRRDFNVPLQLNPDSEYREIRRRKRPLESSGQRVALSRNTRLNLPFEMKEEFIPISRTDALESQIKKVAVSAPEPREVRRKALLKLFEQRTEHLRENEAEAMRLKQRKKKREEDARQEHYERQLKKAKKETAKMQEFRSQHKTKRRPAAK